MGGSEEFYEGTIQLVSVPKYDKAGLLKYVKYDLGSGYRNPSEYKLYQFSKSP